MVQSTVTIVVYIIGCFICNRFPDTFYITASCILISNELEEFSNLYTYIFMHEIVHMFASRYLKEWTYKGIADTVKNGLLTDTLAF